MIIRDAVAGDLPSIQTIINHYRLHTSYLWERRALGMDEMAAWLEDHRRLPYAALVAEEGGEVMGYASLSRFRPYAGYDPTAENSIYLAPGCQGKGCGTALMRALLERARGNGLRVLTAWIDSRNTGSVQFHERFSFELVGTLRNAGTLDGEPVSVIIMQLELA